MSGLVRVSTSLVMVRRMWGQLRWAAWKGRKSTSRSGRMVCLRVAWVFIGVIADVGGKARMQDGMSDWGGVGQCTGMVRCMWGQPCWVVQGRRKAMRQGLSCRIIRV